MLISYILCIVLLIFHYADIICCLIAIGILIKQLIKEIKTKE